MSTQPDSAGNAKPLRFPQFHQEILHQSHWAAGDLLGRIRVVIAEGSLVASASRKISLTE
jgi:hypothetical protein